MKMMRSILIDVNVRVLGYHTISDEEGYVLRDSDLPWAHIMVPAGTGTGVNGIGQLPEYQGGENVLGFFLDGDDAQQPVIIGGFARGHQVEEVEDMQLMMQLVTLIV